MGPISFLNRSQGGNEEEEEYGGVQSDLLVREWNLLL